MWSEVREVKVLLPLFALCISSSVCTRGDGPDSTKTALVKLLVFEITKAFFLFLQFLVAVLGFLSPLRFGVEEGNVLSSVQYCLVFQLINITHSYHVFDPAEAST